jgi:hypothetical protein
VRGAQLHTLAMLCCAVKCCVMWGVCALQRQHPCAPPAQSLRLWCVQGWPRGDVGWGPVRWRCHTGSLIAAKRCATSSQCARTWSRTLLRQFEELACAKVPVVAVAAERTYAEEHRALVRQLQDPGPALTSCMGGTLLCRPANRRVANGMVRTQGCTGRQWGWVGHEMVGHVMTGQGHVIALRGAAHSMTTTCGSCVHSPHRRSCDSSPPTHSMPSWCCFAPICWATFPDS